ncbi:hypothetical protein [Novosphingobium humi]|uniref:hypothetical protein n=1 Tax=Novosphingobium humi TaxID=2282397 RepID=UPI0025B22FD3|nr:hypothetical protein [Novosphingobium humi]WJS99029.1 hypothetical protein NYQ05_02415 [Novosphingobium humi]
MIEFPESLVEDLAPFADLGTEPPRATQNEDGIVIRLVRNGTEFTLRFATDGRIVEQSELGERLHLSFRALLASASFTDLGRWADSQQAFLRSRVQAETIPIVGAISGNGGECTVQHFDDYLDDCWRDRPQPRSVIAVIDGPAGIGKTGLIRSLAFKRAESYRRTQRPLILHVESRGRMLQNITDLMAFSLQTLKIFVTYDQIPVLVRHGLVTLVVDGFDELGDPSGYELAWAQVNELVQSARGGGTLIFAGRETFINRDRILKAIPAIDLSVDRLEDFSLTGVSPAIARDWLHTQGWTGENLDSEAVRPLFEEGSYALRPFFLSELARPGVQQQVAAGEVEELLSFLIAAMVEREAGKFGGDVDAVTTSAQRTQFISRLMEEVARDLAENQAGAIQVETLSWLVEAVCDEFLPKEVTGILKNRAGVIAFLTDDDRRGYRKFIHEYVYNYYLSKSFISSVIDGELTKYIRRNIFGVDFLECFSEVCRNLSQENVDALVKSALNMISTAGDHDRARGNLAAMVISACSAVTPTAIPVIADVSVEEAYVAETMSEIILKNVFIGQMHARSADFRNVKFEGDCSISTLIADDGTVPAIKIPMPAVLALPDKTLRKPEDVLEWFNGQAWTFDADDQFSIDDLLSKLEPFNLLARIVRHKGFWLKDCEERTARRILDDPNWELVKQLLDEHNLLTMRLDVQASGGSAPFYHVKNKAALRDLKHPPKEVWPFLQKLLSESLRIFREDK